MRIEQIPILRIKGDGSIPLPTAVLATCESVPIRYLYRIAWRQLLFNTSRQ
jgi:hypothetical protein